MDKRVFQSALLACLALAAGCLDVEDPTDARPEAVSCPVKTDRKIIVDAKEALGKGEYFDAIELCKKAEANDDACGTAKYCVFIAASGLLIEDTSALVGLVAGQLSPPAGYRTNINTKQIVGSMIEDIEEDMAMIDEYAAKLAGIEDPRFFIDELKIPIDFRDWLSLAGVSFSGDEPDPLDLRGTWDKSEVLLIGAGLNGVQAIIDYAFAHKLVLDSTDFSGTGSAAIASFLASNPDLFAGDTADSEANARLLGGEGRKGLRRDVLAALSFVTGREEEMEGVGPAHKGLYDAIQRSVTSPSEDPLIVWVDENANGIPEGFSVPQVEKYIKDAFNQPALSDLDVIQPPDDATFRILVSEDTMALAMAFLNDSRLNIEAGAAGAPVPIAPLLQSVANDLPELAAEIRFLGKTIPDVVAIHPGAFLDAPKYVGDLLPYYYRYRYDYSAADYYELAYESEVYDQYSGTYVTKPHDRYKYAADSDHFNYVSNDVFPYYKITTYDFSAFLTSPAPIAADGIKPNAKTPRLMYYAFQDPTFGGLLHLDANFAADGSGGNFALPDSFTFNKAVNRVLLYFCANATDPFDMFFTDSGAYSNNPIEQCN